MLTSSEYFRLALGRCEALPAVRTGVVHPVKANVIEAVADAVSEQLIAPVLIGPAGRALGDGVHGGVNFEALAANALIALPFQDAVDFRLHLLLQVTCR